MKFVIRNDVPRLEVTIIKIVMSGIKEELSFHDRVAPLQKFNEPGDSGFAHGAQGGVLFVRGKIMGKFQSTERAFRR